MALRSGTVFPGAGVPSAGGTVPLAIGPGLKMLNGALLVDVGALALLLAPYFGGAATVPTPAPTPNTFRFLLRDGSQVRLRDGSYTSHR